MSIRSLIRSIILESMGDDFIQTGRYLYHASNSIFRDSIDKNGLIPKRDVQWLEDTPIEGEAIFATDSENKEDHFDSTYDDDFWRIDTSKCPEVKWRKDPNFAWDKNSKHVYTKHPIPRSAIELVYKGTGNDTI